jgi:hypothetical protein
LNKVDSFGDPKLLLLARELVVQSSPPSLL